MRKRTVRRGLRFIVASLVVIVMASFYNARISELLLFSASAETSMYQIGLLWAAVLGGYGVVLTVAGCAMSPLKNEVHIRILPAFIGVSVLILIFFLLLSVSINTPSHDEPRRLRSGETITI